MSAAPPVGVHATVVLAGERAILIRGASGSGKSRLAQAVLAEAGRRGVFARLVGDDRVLVTVTNGRALARPHPAVAGLIEQRGAGLLAVPHEPAALVACLLDLVALPGGAEAVSRMPEAPEEAGDLAGLRLPRLGLPSSLGPEEAARRALAFLDRVPK